MLATWHAYAKLRLHTETTLSLFDSTTKLLGSILRRFANTTCSVYETRELPREEAARGRRKAALAKKKNATGMGTSKKGAEKGKEKESGGPARKLLNLCTYKLHALGDYVQTIWRFGTTDNYSTQVVRIRLTCYYL